MNIGSTTAASGMNRVEMKKDRDCSTFFTRRIDRAYAAGTARTTEMIVAVTDAVSELMR